MVEDVFGILGTTLAGTFRIEEVIAEGGFGVVYRATHVAFRAPVALKCLKIPGTITPDQSELFVENFREEAEILFHLSAQIPEVVRPLHADAMTLADGTFVPYIAMEWIEGRPLDSIVIMREDDGLPPLSLRSVIGKLTPIAHALNKAHQFQVPGGAVVSVTHCDLKPENILITAPDSAVRAKVLDFGIARARDMMRQNVGRITDSENTRPFTPGYGAPEQWVPKRYGQSGPWTDVWGLALTMTECLSGRPPIEGDMHAMMGTCLDKSRRPTPRAEGADVPEEVDAVFEKALAVDPRSRFNDIEAFWCALEEAAQLPSSFQRARRRRANPTFAPAAAIVAEDSLEFDGLELEEPTSDGQRSADLSAASASEPAAYDRLAEDDRFGVAGSGAPSSDLDHDGEFVMDEDSPGPSSNIELDLGDSERPEPPASTSGSRAAVASNPMGRSGNSWERQSGSLSRSGRYPPPSSARRRGRPEPMDTSSSDTAGLKSLLRVPLILVAVGLGLTLLDMVLVKVMGGTLSLGPIRVRWIAAALAAAGIVMAFWNLFDDKDSDPDQD